MFCLLFILSSVVEATTKQEVTRLVEVLEMLVPKQEVGSYLSSANVLSQTTCPRLNLCVIRVL